jgi:hypothetical protein
VCCASEVDRSTSFKRGEGLSRLNCARTTKHTTPADANTRLRRALDIARNFVSSNLNAFLMGIASIAILIRTNLLIFLASRPISAGGLRLLRRDLTAKALRTASGLGLRVPTLSVRMESTACNPTRLFGLM